MFDPGMYQGCHLGEAEIAQVRGLIARHPQWRRRRISPELARLWDWRTASGQLKEDMAAHALLLKLQWRGRITLPPRRRAPGNRMARRMPLGADLFPGQAAAEIRVAQASPASIFRFRRKPAG